MNWLASADPVCLNIRSELNVWWYFVQICCEASCCCCTKTTLPVRWIMLLLIKPLRVEVRVDASSVWPDSNHRGNPPRTNVSLTASSLSWRCERDRKLEHLQPEHVFQAKLWYLPHTYIKTEKFNLNKKLRHKETSSFAEPHHGWRRVCSGPFSQQTDGRNSNWRDLRLKILWCLTVSLVCVLIGGAAQTVVTEGINVDGWDDGINFIYQ